MEKFTDVTTFIAWVEKQVRFTPKTSLKKMIYLCDLFQHPEHKFKAIHITGTNGKGSVVAYLRSILKEAGLKVGTFTSPYVTYFNERIQFDGKYISDDNLLKYANLIIEKYPIIASQHQEYPTFFEFITLLCFLYFADLPELDLAIIEVGMGGRLDATNVVNSILTIITNVSLEHTAILGDTEDKILHEKLGIVKENIPLITGISDFTLQKEMLSYCEFTHSPLICCRMSEVEIKKMDTLGTDFMVDGLMFHTPLLGYHQVANALVAIRAIETLKKYNHDQKWNELISNVILSKGLNKTNWPGRLEILSSNPLIMVDGAHNDDGIEQVCAFISLLDYPFKRCIVAISNDKDKKTMINFLDQTFDEIIFTKYSYHRSANPDELYALSQNPQKKVIPSLSDVYAYIAKNPASFNIFIGSLYLVTDVKKQTRW